MKFKQSDGEKSGWGPESEKERTTKRREKRRKEKAKPIIYKLCGNFSLKMAERN